MHRPPSRPSSSLVLACLLAFAPALGSQGLGTLQSVPGRVVDLCPELGAATSFLYCTAEGEVGRLTSGGLRTVLATAASAPFPKLLRALVQLPSGELVVLDEQGDLYRLPSSGGAATKIYSDLYLIADPTDLVVDTLGTFLIASRTPSSGVRALDFVSADGQRWAYYLVQHQPLALAADPLGPGVLFSDEAGGGALRRVDSSDPAHAASLLESGANPAFSAAKLDGDLALETDGDALYVAGSKLWKLAHGGSSSSLQANAATTLRGVCIAASSGNLPSSSGWSAYLAEGEAPTQIREFANVGAPASPLCSSLGSVPDRGKQLMFFSGLNVFELARDKQGHLLVGGDLWGASAAVRRIQLPGLQSTTIATAAQGLLGRIEGLALDAHGLLHALSFSGSLQSVAENPLVLNTLYADAPDLVLGAKDLLLTRQGSALFAERSGYGTGEVLALAAGASALESLVDTAETRGLVADPFSARALVTQWNGTGFQGSVDALDVAAPSSGLAPLGGFSGMNYTNAASWGDGDVVADAYGNLYSCSEDDWSLVRYERESGKRVRIGSSYLNHPSGLAIAISSGQTPSSSGWSLYVAEWNWLYEIGGVPAPAPGLLDPSSPACGRGAGFAAPAQGEPRALCAAADGSCLYLATAASQVLRLDPATRVVSTVAGPAQGLAGDLIGIAVRPNGALLVAARDGRVFELAPSPSFAVSPLYADASNSLSDVRGLCLDGSGRVLLVERPAGAQGARLMRLENGTAQLLLHSARGLRPALDPLTGEVWLSEQGAAGSFGELLRVQAAQAPARAGHLRQESFTTWQQGDLEGGLVFRADGDLFVAEGGSGRLWLVDRQGGARSLIGGNYDAPKGVALAQGTAGVAGAQGTSAYVLDGWAVYERGVEGLAAPLAPQNGASELDLWVAGLATPGASHALAVHSPPDAGRVYVILPTFSGKLPGLPLADLGDASDPRLLPLNLDALFGSLLDPALMPGFLGVLDAAGNSAPQTALVLPPDPALLQFGAFLDFVWVALDPAAQNGVARVGGTAQLYLGP